MLALARKLARRQSRVVEVDFHFLGEIRNIEPIAANLSIRERKTLKVLFGGRRWRKLKGVALVRFPNGEVASRRIALVRSLWASAAAR